MTDDERSEQQRNRRGVRWAALIADGLSSFGNLFFSSKGAPAQELPKTKNGAYGLSGALAEKESATDKDYEHKHSQWLKDRATSEAREAREAAENARVTFGDDDFGLKASNWSSKDYITRLFDLIESRHPSDAVSRNIEGMRYRRGREASLSLLGHTVFTEKLYDRLKERGSHILKREIIRQLLQEGLLDDDTLAKLKQEITDFDQLWTPMK